MFQRDLQFVHKYFMAERQAALGFLVIGSVAIIVALLFYFFIRTHPAFFKGAAIPLLLLGLLTAIAGFTLFQRSNQQRLHAAYAIGIDPGFIRQEELPRMEKVLRNFRLLFWVELVLLATGLSLFIYYRPAMHWAGGLGLSLAIMAGMMLLADQLAEKRARIYTKELAKQINN